MLFTLYTIQRAAISNSLQNKQTNSVLNFTITQNFHLIELKRSTTLLDTWISKLFCCFIADNLYNPFHTM